MNAFAEILANVTVTDFHLCQSVLRKINELGLMSTYESDAEFALHICMLMGLAFISVVRPMYTLLCQLLAVATSCLLFEGHANHAEVPVDASEPTPELTSVP